MIHFFVIRSDRAAFFMVNICVLMFNNVMIDSPDVKCYAKPYV